MKKKMFLLIAVLITIESFGKPKLGVHSVNDFEKLYKNNVFPFNKISDTTFQRLKSGISFDEEKRFRGFIFIGGLRKELTFDEYQKFNELISGTKVTFSEEDKAEYERRRNLK